MTLYFQTFLRETFHVIGPWGDVRVKFPCTWWFCYGSNRDFGSKHISVIVHSLLACFTVSFGCNPNKRSHLSVAPAEILDSNMLLQLSNNIVAYLTFSLSATHINMVEECRWFSQINVFRENFPCRTKVLLFPKQYNIFHIRGQE